jgi:hypothetical protein
MQLVPRHYKLGHNKRGYLVKRRFMTGSFCPPGILHSTYTKTSQTCIDFPQSSSIHRNSGVLDSFPLCCIPGNKVGHLDLFKRHVGHFCRCLYATSSDHTAESTRRRWGISHEMNWFFLHWSMLHWSSCEFVRKSSHGERRWSYYQRSNLCKVGLNRIALRGGGRNCRWSGGRCNLSVSSVHKVITGVWGGEKLLGWMSESMNDPECGDNGIWILVL